MWRLRLKQTASAVSLSTHFVTPIAPASIHVQTQVNGHAKQPRKQIVESMGKGSRGTVFARSIAHGRVGGGHESRFPHVGPGIGRIEPGPVSNFTRQVLQTLGHGQPLRRLVLHVRKLAKDAVKNGLHARRRRARHVVTHATPFGMALSFGEHTTPFGMALAIGKHTHRR